MLTWSSLAAPGIVIMTTCRVTIDDKVDIMATHCLQWRHESSHLNISLRNITPHNNNIDIQCQELIHILDKTSNTKIAWPFWGWNCHYCDVIMGAVASKITSLTIAYSTVYSDADQRKHQSSASLAFVRGIHRGPVNSPHKRPVTRKMLPFDDVIM